MSLQKEEIEKEEFWKITELKKYLLILIKEDKLRCEITRSGESDVTEKIKLMQEAMNFGFQQGSLFKEKEMLDDEIKFLSWIIGFLGTDKNTKRAFEVTKERLENIKKDYQELKQRLSKLNSQQNKTEEIGGLNYQPNTATKVEVFTSKQVQIGSADNKQKLKGDEK